MRIIYSHVIVLIILIQVALCDIADRCSYMLIMTYLYRGKGFYNSKRDECLCFDGYEGVKCQSRKCKSGKSWSKSGEYSVCSDRGDCDDRSGLCTCYSGYSGDDCSIKGCENDCSLHGSCISDYEYYNNHMKKVSDNSGYVVEDSGITITEEMKNRFRCLCESGYSGSDCSYRIYNIYEWYLIIIK